MSTTDNIHRKVLSNNALKTNFISNTNQKNKSQNEKRFSNISRQKQTVQKNTVRYCQQVDMQGSATILPQKSTSRPNIYTNQNSNHIVQMTSNQKKQYMQVNLNAKAKSPILKNRINIQVTRKNNDKMIPQIKNTSRTTDIKTERQKSVKAHHQKQNQKQQFKTKSKIMNKQIRTQIQDLICNQEMDITILPQKQHARKLSNNILTKNDSYKSNKQDLSINTDLMGQYNNRTQKKCPIDKIDKPVLMVEREKSQHNLALIQQICGNSGFSANQMISTANPLLCNIAQLNNVQYGHLNQVPSSNPNFQSIINRQSSKIHPPQTSINYEQQLKRFSYLETQINQNGQSETIFRLQNRQKWYLVQPNYIEVKQRNFNWFMRAVLMDWMVHVCFQFGLKRQTYYIAVSIVDKYLQKSNDLAKSQFQLVGAASMFIATKLQQFQALSSVDFSKSTDNRYSPIQIKQMQLKICKTMNYQLNPPTLYMWANRFMIHWDNYVQNTSVRFHLYFEGQKPKYFKKQYQESYLLFREIMQMIDCAILDVQTLQFSPKILVCSFMYLVLGKNYKEWPTKRIVQEFPRSSHYLVTQEQTSSFNNLFHMFLSDSFELDIIQLLPAVQYCSTFFTLQLNFQTPSYALKGQDEQQSQMSLQQYQSFQTYNGKIIDLVKRRFRGVYL